MHGHQQTARRDYLSSRTCEVCFPDTNQAILLAVKLSNHNMLDDQAYQDGRVEVDFALVKGNMHDISSDQVFYSLALWRCEFVDIAIRRIFWDLLKVEKLVFVQTVNTCFSLFFFQIFVCEMGMVWRATGYSPFLSRRQVEQLSRCLCTLLA